jgi:hypothetical protein
MATQPKLLPLSPLPPLTPEDIDYDPFPIAIPPDILQLQADTLNVLEGRVPITSFTSEYQDRIKDYYRYAAVLQTSKSHNIAQRTPDTLDIL